MKTATLLLFSFLLTAAGPLKNSDLRPGVSEPMIPGTQTPVEKLNTAPTSPNLEADEKKSRNTTLMGTSDESSSKPEKKKK